MNFLLCPRNRHQKLHWYYSCHSILILLATAFISSLCFLLWNVFLLKRISLQRFLFLISKGDLQKVGKDLLFLKVVFISRDPDVDIFWWCPTLFCGCVYNSSIGVAYLNTCVLGNSQESEIIYIRRVVLYQNNEPNQQKGEISHPDTNRNCVCLLFNKSYNPSYEILILDL